MLALERFAGRPRSTANLAGRSGSPGALLRRGPLRTTACGFHRTGLKQAHPARSARSSSIPSRRPLVRSPPRRRLTCPRVLTLTDVVVRVHLTTSAPFRVRVCPYPASYPGRPAKARLSRPGFPVAFRPPAFASWSSCARQGTGPSLRSAYRSLLPGPDPDGVATFRAHELRPGWVPFLPRGLRCPHGRQVIPGRRMPPCSGRPCTPVQQPTTGGFLSRGIIKGSRSFTRPGLPLACSSRVEREPSGFFPGLHTPPLPAAHAGVGTGIVGTYLSYVTISWSSTQRSHSPRATSCRTDLMRACPPPRAALPCPVRTPAPPDCNQLLQPFQKRT